MKNAGGKAFALFAVAALLFGCSSFNRDWKKAAQQPVPADSMTGRWEGTWASSSNGHSGTLRCLMSKTNEAQYVARFRATYAKVLSFSYAVPLAVDPHYDGWEFSGEANLGKAAGGVYYYEGRASPTNFFSTYKASGDHGVFEMRRPK
jgi:hypothetical protein